MKRSRYVLAAFGLAAVFTFVVLRLFDVDFATGQAYPEYSSFRADPKGSKLLFDSLTRLPGLSVSRNELPLNTLKLEGATLVLIACDPGEAGLDVLDALASKGARLVLALPDELETTAPERFGLRHWGLRFEKVAPKIPGGDPTWRLVEAKGWTVLDQDGDTLIAAARTFGKGSIAIFADSKDFANSATAEYDASDLSPMAQALSANSRIVFDESHLGVAEAGSVIALAKRFRLIGLALGFAILAALFIWRNTSSFPPAHERNRGGPARSASQGLETLLRRHVPVSNLAEDCWREWLATSRREFAEARITRAGEAVRSLAKTPLDAARRVHEVLYSKGEL